MAKWHGKVGFGMSTESSPGVWTNEVISKFYSGDIIKNTIRNSASGEVNDDITISNRISILADPFAVSNLPSILFVEFMGNLWKVSDVEVNFPRMILSIGGIYNGNTT